MDLQGKKERLLVSLEQIRIRLQQLQTELGQRQAQEQQVLGAIMLVDELMAEETAEAEREAKPPNNTTPTRAGERSVHDFDSTKR